MRAPLPLRTAGVLAAIPLAVLLALAALHRLPWSDALLSAAVIAAGSILVAQLWVRDLRRVIWALHRAAPDADAADLPPPRVGAPLLSATAHITREADRLARAFATRQQQMQDIVRAEQALVRRLPDPMIVLGPGRSVHRTNAAAEAAFGPAIPAVLRHPGLRAAIDRALAEGQEQSAELNLPVPVSREVFATVIPLEPPLADGGRIVAVLSDRSRERAVERMRADFVANASHELRTPLASLIGFIDTLRGPAADDPPAQIRFLGIMAEQAQRMNRLIDDLLSLSRIELTEHQAPGDQVDLVQLSRRLAAAFEPQIKARRMSVDIDCPPVPLVPGDEDQLEQVLQNLLDNAVKYGRDSGTLRLSVHEAPPGKPWPPRPGVALSVTDDGAGIARAHIPRLTERFYRADKHRSRAVGGTGLGLAIVKHIVNRHRGQLLIESTEGTGTTVTVWLPQVTPPPTTSPVVLPQAQAEIGAAARA
jgi:two-component system phosphate regulon sensor histidine kinase PhoR